MIIIHVNYILVIIIVVIIFTRYIFEYLKICIIDIREYAILALRNLLIDNPDNQKLLEELKPIGTVQSDVLKQAGIKTELGKDGKIRVMFDRR